jgi:uncharacterized membrane protein
MNRTPLVKNTLRIALRAHADAKVQTQLNELDLPLPTTLQQGLASLLRASALIVLGAADHWVYGTSRSRVFTPREPTIADSPPEAAWHPHDTPIARALPFPCMSSSIIISHSQDPEERYVEVTLVVLTQGIAPISGELYTQADMHRALLQLGSLPASCLLNVEVFWSPQSANKTLDRTELLNKYPDLMPLGSGYR